MNYGVSRTCTHGVDRYLACASCGTADDPKFAASQLHALATRRLARDDRYAEALVAFLWTRPASPEPDAEREPEKDALRHQMGQRWLAFWRGWQEREDAPIHGSRLADVRAAFHKRYPEAASLDRAASPAPSSGGGANA